MATSRLNGTNGTQAQERHQQPATVNAELIEARAALDATLSEVAYITDQAQRARTQWCRGGNVADPIGRAIDGLERIEGLCKAHLPPAGWDAV